jgi:hypothetical protein
MSQQLLCLLAVWLWQRPSAKVRRSNGVGLICQQRPALRMPWRSDRQCEAQQEANQNKQSVADRDHLVFSVCVLLDAGANGGLPTRFDESCQQKRCQ